MRYTKFSGVPKITFHELLPFNLILIYTRVPVLHHVLKMHLFCCEPG